jgi:hypothetical protein
MEFWAQIYLGRARGALINQRRWEEFLRRTVTALTAASTATAEVLTQETRCRYCDQSGASERRAQATESQRKAPST